jgi:two-component system response regulator RegX3
VGGRALVVEGDQDYATLASELLRRDGWQVEIEPDGRAALQRLHADGFNVVLVDTVSSTLEDGRFLLAEIRGASDAPVIVLSAPDDREEVVEQALESADYDLVKPFSPRRLRAAVRAVTRRGRADAASAVLPAEVRVGDVTMSFGRLEVVVGDRRVELSPREFALLHLLVAHAGRTLERQFIFERVWGQHFYGDQSALDVYVRQLRRKIERDPARPVLLETVRGVGYRFADSAP